MDSLNLIKVIDKDQITQLQKLAYIIFPQTYQSILSKAQIDFMLDMMYSEKVIVEQLQKGVSYFLLNQGKEPIGYLALEKNLKQEKELYIHKIYILSKFQGRGYGQWLLKEVEFMALQHNLNSLGLSVNRENKAKNFYFNNGFVIVTADDVDIGNGFYMNDYYLTKSLK